MLENKSIPARSVHELILLSREKLSIRGITEILNFDENEVCIKTVCGDLLIDGNNIHVNVLNINEGELEITGKINGINYSDQPDEKKSILSKIFK